jgi:hypothetical protein
MIGRLPGAALAARVFDGCSDQEPGGGAEGKGSKNGTLRIKKYNRREAVTG